MELAVSVFVFFAVFGGSPSVQVNSLLPGAGTGVSESEWTMLRVAEKDSGSNETITLCS